MRIAVTVLIFLAWHFPTTFFVPSGTPNERGWIVWPFGQQTRPALDAFAGVIAPSAPTATGTPTVALAAAGIASLAFIVAAGSLWGIVIPGSWFQLAVIAGAVSSVILFLVYMSPLALIPLQRALLFAASRGLAAQPLNQIFERADREATAKLAPMFASALTEITPSGWQAITAFRIGHASAPPRLAPRRLAEEVILT